MGKATALGSYFYQALLAFGLLLVVARLLSPSGYATYSVFIAATQMGAIASFEWIRFACSRFYPGADSTSEASQRATMFTEFAICTALCAVAAIIAPLFGVPIPIATLAFVVVVLQGASDLHLTMLRFRQRFGAFSILQGLRATMLAAGTLTGAVLTRDVLGALGGLAAGYVAMAVVSLVVEKRSRLERGATSRALAKVHIVYGTASSSASVLSLAAPLGLRLILTATFGDSVAAGALLAVDLLQRPFVLVISAIHGVFYPVVVSAFDKGDREHMPRLLGDFYTALFTLSILTAAGLCAILPWVSAGLVPSNLQAGFRDVVPIMLFVSLLRAITQNISTTPAHLLRRLRVLLSLAVVDALGLTVLAFAASRLPGASVTSVTAAAAVGVLIYAVAGGFAIRALPFVLSWRPVAAACVGLLAAALMSLTTWTTWGVVTAIVTVGLATVAVLLFYMRDVQTIGTSFLNQLGRSRH